MKSIFKVHNSQEMLLLPQFLVHSPTHDLHYVNTVTVLQCSKLLLRLLDATQPGADPGFEKGGGAGGSESNF